MCTTHSVRLTCSKHETQINCRQCSCPVLLFLESSLKLQAFRGEDQFSFTRQHNPGSETHQFLTPGGLAGGPRSEIANNLWAVFRTDWLLPADVERTRRRGGRGNACRAAGAAGPVHPHSEANTRAEGLRPAHSAHVPDGTTAGGGNFLGSYLSQEKQKEGNYWGSKETKSEGRSLASR